MIEQEIRSAIASNQPINWPELREAILAAHDGARSTEERVSLLQLFTELMNHVEATQISPNDIPQFRDTRVKDYRLLLVQEARIGDNACVEMLDEVTRREIAAGRMAPDDELRQVTIQGLTAPHPSRSDLEAMAARSKQSFWGRLFGKR